MYECTACVSVSGTHVKYASAEVLERLRRGGVSVVLTANAASASFVRAAMPRDARHLVMTGGRLMAAPPT